MFIEARFAEQASCYLPASHSTFQNVDKLTLMTLLLRNHLKSTWNMLRSVRPIWPVCDLYL